MTRSAVTVKLAIDDSELAQRVRLLLMEHPDIEIADVDDGRAPRVWITDGAAELAQGEPVVVLTDAAGAAEALQAGAAAVMSENVGGEALCAAIGAAAQGLTAVSREFRDCLLEGLDVRGGLESDEEHGPAVDLTPREHQVLRHLAEGASNKAIARELGITPHTAKFHVASIIAKLAATGRTDAVAKAIRLGLVMV